MKRSFLNLILFSGFSFCLFSIGANLFSDESVPVRQADAFDSIAWAEQDGEISLKDSVMLRAKLLFAPEVQLNENEKNSLRRTAENVTVDEPCGTAFYKDVHRVFPELDGAEKIFLSSLDPSLECIISTREAEDNGMKTKSALPTFPELDKEVEGTSCIVHYSLTDATHKVPDQNYADLVKVYMDMAIKAIPKKKFKAALPEGGGKLHVYVRFIGAGTGGQWVDVSIQTGRAKSGYIMITNSYMTDYPLDVWQVYLKSTCYHEYFHGVQSAYNWASSLWFMEGTCTWVEVYFCKNKGALTDVFSSANSVFNSPQLPIWDNSFHKYSTVTLACFFYGKHGGVKFIKKYFEKTEAEDDAIPIFKALLTERKKDFSTEFKKYLAAMYTKKINSIGKQMIDVKKTEINSYGVIATENTLSQLGAVFYLLKPQADIPKAPLVYAFNPGATGTPEAFMLKSIKIIPIIGGAGIKNFGSSPKEIVFVATDTTYAAQDATARSFEYMFLTPYINITGTTVFPLEMEPGDTSRIDITYDLLGTVAGEQFPMQLKLTERGPGVRDSASGEYNIDPGTGQSLFPCHFVTTESISPGNFRFTVQLSVPPDSWNVPQSFSKTTFSIRVTEPPEQGSAPVKTNSNECGGVISPQEFSTQKTQTSK